VSRVGLRRAGPPASEQALAAAERKLGFALPGDLRAFLAEHDGAELEDNDLERPVGHLSGGADTVYALTGLVRERTWARERMPPEFTPVGDAGGGNRLVLGVDGDVRGRVFHWNHELESEPPSRAGLTELAPSFCAWLERLVPADDVPDLQGRASIDPEFLAQLERDGLA
jgi:hypothetical protein